MTQKHSLAKAALLGAFSLFGAAASASAAVIEANPSNYRNLLGSLSAGDTLVLASGTYTLGLPIEGMSGAQGSPIIIRGPDDRSAIFTARSCCNTVQLDNTSYVEVRNLTLDGANLDGPFGVDARGASHHITLENLKIINHGADQQTVGISTKGPAWNWIIRRNTIIGAGTGLYLGNSDGTEPFVGGLIEHNLIVDTVGYNMEIKHQLARPTGLGLPTGQSRTIIRHNVFSKRNNASTGSMARPCLLVGHFPLSGTGATDVYEIYGNFFYENPSEALFQGEGNIALHDNLFVNSAGDAINIQAHNDRPRDVTVYHNTVVASAGGISISGGAAGYTQRIVGNAVFAGLPVSGPNQANNITGSYASASNALVAPFAQPGTLDLFPKSGQLTGTAMDLSAYSSLSDGKQDFNGRARTGIHRGAYEGDGTNDGWRPALAIKPQVNGAAAPSLSLNADPTQVSLQGSSTLHWSATNASSCTASGGWSGNRSLNGSETVGPITANSTYSLTCTGEGGSITRSITVSVVGTTPAPTVNLDAAPASITAGGSSTLSWQSSGASTCTASGGWSGDKAVTGSQLITALGATATFTLTCTGAGGSATDSATVTVTSDSGGSSGGGSGTGSGTDPGTGSGTGGSGTGSTTGSVGGGGALPPGLLLSLMLLLGYQATRRRRTSA